MIIRSVTPDSLLVAIGIFHTSQSVYELSHRTVSYANFTYDFPTIGKVWQEPYTIDTIDVIFWFFKIMTLVVLVWICLSQLLMKSAKFQVLGWFSYIFSNLRGYSVKFSHFEPQKAILYSKGHVTVYFVKPSYKRCRLHSCSRTPSSRMYMLDVCWKVAPYANVIKLDTVGLNAYAIALTAVGTHQLTCFGVLRHPIWVSATDKINRAQFNSPRYHGKAWWKLTVLKVY